MIIVSTAIAICHNRHHIVMTNALFSCPKSLICAARSACTNTATSASDQAGLKTFRITPGTFSRYKRLNTNSLIVLTKLQHKWYQKNCITYQRIPGRAFFQQLISLATSVNAS
jgi:hypothetical protein